MTTKEDTATPNPGPASAPNLDAWRAEAGEAVPLSNAATAPPWRSTWPDPPGEPEADDIAVEAVGRTGIERIVVGALWYDGPNSACRAEDAAFIAAARTGWPRDAARVARLCTLLAEAEHNVRTLRAALAVAERAASLCAGEVVELEAGLREALDGWEGAVDDVGCTSHHTIKRLRALAAGTSTTGEEPTR